MPSHPNLIESEPALAEIVRTTRSIAVVGMKDERQPEAAAYEVPRAIAARGFDVIPVNPKIESSLGERAFPDIAAVGRAVDLVDVFRRPDAIPDLADQIIALPADRRPRVVWLQSGIRHDAAARKLADAGIKVVQDRCLGVYVGRYARGRS